METQKLLQADYLDIIFDKRNKKYGSYELRTNYRKRLLTGMVFLLVGVVALSSFSLVRRESNVVPHGNTVVVQPRIIDNLVPSVPKPKILPERPVEPPKKVKTQLFTDPVVTADPIKPDQQMTKNSDLDNAAPGPRNSDGDAPGIVPSGPGKVGTGVVAPEHSGSTKPLVYVEQMPAFIGDRDAYINSHLRYPDAARESNIEGRVIIQFVVNEDGTVSDAVVVKGIGGGCDEEALRMVNGMPKWKPGKQNGMPVKVIFTLPIKFILR